MVKKSKGRQRPLSLSEFMRSPSSMPPPSPASTLASTPRNNGFSTTPSPRDIWTNSPRSVLAPPTREDYDDNGRLLIRKRDTRYMPPFAPPVPIPPSTTKTESLEDGGYNNIRKEVCFPGTNIRKVTNEVERRKITKKIENFVDWMAEQHVPKGFWIGKENPFVFHESLCTNRKTGHLCTRDVKCALLPDHDVQKSFIPQLYHLLQDYGLFLEYMEIMNNDEKDEDMSILIPLVDDWLIDAGETFAQYRPREKIYRYKEMLKNIRRVEFLRSFNSICCKDKKNKHEAMDALLKRIYGALERKVERLEKNYGYL